MTMLRMTGPRQATRAIPSPVTMMMPFLASMTEPRVSTWAERKEATRGRGTNGRLHQIALVEIAGSRVLTVPQAEETSDTDRRPVPCGEESDVLDRGAGLCAGQHR